MAAILHRVKKGETVFSICMTFGLPYEKFVALNEKFIGLNFLDFVEVSPGLYVAVGDSLDPLDVLRVTNRRSI